jgi:hypothetical protein
VEHFGEADWRMVAGEDMKWSSTLATQSPPHLNRKFHLFRRSSGQQARIRQDGEGAAACRIIFCPWCERNLLDSKLSAGLHQIRLDLCHRLLSQWEKWFIDLIGCHVME